MTSMTDYESSRKVHGLPSESGDSDSGSDTDSDAYNFLRPPTFNYDDIKDNIVVVEPRNVKQNKNENTTLKKRGKKKKRWLPLTQEVIKTLENKTENHSYPEEADDSRYINFAKVSPSQTKKSNLQLKSENSSSMTESSMSEATEDQTNEQTDTLQKFQNAWGNFFYQQPREELKNSDSNCNESSSGTSNICDNIKQIWSSDVAVKDNIDNPTKNKNALQYFQNVWDNVLYPNCEIQPDAKGTDKHEFVSYFSDDFVQNNDMKFESLEENDKQAEEENVSDCLSSIQDIMPEDLLRKEILSEFKHFLYNFADLEKTQQHICIDSLNFESVLTKSSVALYDLRIVNNTLKSLVSFKIPDKVNSTSDAQDVNASTPIAPTQNTDPNENSPKDLLDNNAKISPSKNTNVVKPYTFVKADKNVAKVENKKTAKKCAVLKESRCVEKASSKEKAKLELKEKEIESATVVENTEDLSTSELHSLEELEIAEMEKTLNALEFDDSNSESDCELYDKTTKTVSFVILLSKVMYIILIVIPYRNIVGFFNYLKSWSYVRSCYTKIIGQPIELKYKNMKKKMKKFHKTYLKFFINIKFFKTILVALGSFHLFLKIESIQPFLIWFYSFNTVLVFDVLPVVFSVFEFLFLKPLYCFYDILFKNTFLKTSHTSKFLFCLVAIYYIYKVTNLILKGMRTCLVQPFRKFKRYVKSQYEFLIESLIEFQNQTFVSRKDRKERDFKMYKMRQIRRRN